MAGMETGVPVYGGNLFNQELSLELAEQAQPLMRYVQFCDVDEAFGSNHGKTWLFDKVLDVTTEGGEIPENGDFQEVEGRTLQSSMTLKIYGNSIPYTELLMRTSKFDIKNQNHRWIINDMAKVRNRKAAAQFTSGKVKYTPTGTAGGGETGTWVTNGTVAATASRHFSMFDLLEILEAMKSGYYPAASAVQASPIPPYDQQGKYICLCSPGFATAMWKDSDFLKGLRYGDPDRVFAGEMGEFMGVRFIEDNHILANYLGTTVYKGEALFFGAQAVKHAINLPPEIREDLPTKAGLARRQVWVSIEAWKIFWELNSTVGDDYEPENRIIHVTSV